MNHQRLYGLEKILVQATALAGLLAVYFGFGAALRSWDPTAPITFVPTGGYSRALTFAAMVWVLAAACAVVTISARAEGTLLAVLAGVAGVSLKSPPVRALFWTSGRSVRGVLGAFVLEILLLAAVLFVAVLVIGAVRKLISLVRPGWVWRNPLDDLTDQQRKTIRDALSREKKSSSLLDARPGLPRPGGTLGALFPLVGMRRSEGTGDAAARRELLVRSAMCLATAMLIAMVMVLLLMKSAQRGQIIFALAVSFGVGMLVAHQFFPTPLSILAWLAPFPAAAALYGLGAISVTPAGPLTWTMVPYYARALPVDWLAAGAGGALLGFWISSRIHELRILERLKKDQKGDKNA